MLARIRKAMEEREGGFTLIEPLVVIIIGILAAIAIPTFLNQRKKAWEKAAYADLHNNATKMEEYADGNGGAYPATTVDVTTVGFKVSGTDELPKIEKSGVGGYCLSVKSTPLGTVYYLNSKTGTPSATSCAAIDYTQ